MNLKVGKDNVFPVDPEASCQYSRFDQLNPAWWRNVESLVRKDEGELFPAVRISDKGVELPWFNRSLRLEPETLSIRFDNGKGPQPTYQEGLVVLALLNYLAGSQKMPEIEGLISESHLTGGTTFFQGPHVMASVLIAERFARDGSQLLAKGKKWGAQASGFGEFALSFKIFPGLEWTIALWEEDDEFSARALYLFDKNIERMFQLDVVWALGNVVAAKLL
ncbi:MAG: DUF3786 domain-containing protein [Deltaproteobacteria bacterium]|nr:DUF3786 domain-containing protein [Candidatus Tharpella sp.]